MLVMPGLTVRGGVVLKVVGGIWIFGIVCGLSVASVVPIDDAHAAAKLTTVYSFEGQSDGEFPEAGLTDDGSGTLYSTTFGELGGGEVPGKKCAKSCGNVYDFAHGGLNSLYHFTNSAGSGSFPTGELAIQKDMIHDTTEIYGTTEYGAGTACGGLGCGTAFSLTSTSEGKKFFQFCGTDFPDCKSGALPRSGPIVDSAGNMYGTTTLGGTSSGNLCDNNFRGCGVIYMLTPQSGTFAETPLYNFCSLAQCADGAVPYGRLLMDSSGNLFGTTEFGGTYSEGTIFELQFSNGTYAQQVQVLYSFCEMTNCSDGSLPEAGLFEDSNGNLYGTTTYGGKTSCDDGSGCGVVFKLAPPPQGQTKWTETVLHRFKGRPDGAFPQAPVLTDSAGNLYGTTLRGGRANDTHCTDSFGCGTVFSISPGGSEKVLHSFGKKPGTKDGAHPEGALLLENNQYLYGVTRLGGRSKCKCGTIFELSLDGPAATARLR